MYAYFILLFSLKYANVKKHSVNFSAYYLQKNLYDLNTI